MPRYIDADAFKKQIAAIAIANSYPLKKLEKVNALCELIDAQPTAYDIEDVCSRLEANAFWTEPTYDEDGYSNDDAEVVVPIETALAIVRAGSKN